MNFDVAFYFVTRRIISHVRGRSCWSFPVGEFSAFPFEWRVSVYSRLLPKCLNRGYRRAGLLVNERCGNTIFEPGESSLLRILRDIAKERGKSWYVSTPFFLSLPQNPPLTLWTAPVSSTTDEFPDFLSTFLLSLYIRRSPQLPRSNYPVSVTRPLFLSFWLVDKLRTYARVFSFPLKFSTTSLCLRSTRIVPLFNSILRNRNLEPLERFSTRNNRFAQLFLEISLFPIRKIAHFLKFHVFMSIATWLASIRLSYLKQILNVTHRVVGRPFDLPFCVLFGQVWADLTATLVASRANTFTDDWKKRSATPLFFFFSPSP